MKFDEIEKKCKQQEEIIKHLKEFFIVVIIINQILFNESNIFNKNSYTCLKPQKKCP